MHQAFIALGSNLQNPQAQVERALQTIANTAKIKLIKASSLYKTAPVGYENQPDFINAVAEIETDLSPVALLQKLLEIETQHGRERPFPNAPRILDLDVLLYEGIATNTPELTLPHPRMHLRGFVMLPLAEIAPKINIGNHGYADDLAAKCDNQGISKL
ncbi:MAG: 2-amino-4-hydroxy-6-hydroxymethyldihydropteridine diphosphokinase [Methylophilaceae bacterium]|nr:2-amino-4-hydroxy-6-hydroxymethyldihydropteridine diphosphokinase [Methylophilaceae bacterium]